jgi:glycosyltransferase involved in cell wall biosynthesis
LINQKFDNYEIVVVNNNSTDDTEIFLEEIINKFKSKFIIVKNLKKNYGVAGGRNIGFKISIGTYAYFIDDDAYIKNPNFLAELYDFMQNNLDIGALATKIYDTKDCVYNQTHLSKEYLDSYLHEVFIFKGGSHAIRKSIYGQNEDLYPSNLFFGSEEYYASLTLVDKGYKIVLNDKLEVTHSPGVYSEFNREEEKMRILINQFIVKKYKFSKILYPYIYIAFFIRIVRNCKINKNNLIKIASILKNTYDEKYRKPIKLSIIFLLLKKYGFKIL